MNAEQIIKYISEAEKKTKVKVYVRWRKGKGIWPESCKVFSGTDQIVSGASWGKASGRGKAA